MSTIRHEYLQQLGELTSRFNMLELSLKSIVCNIINPLDHKMGMIVCNQLTTSNILILCESLVYQYIKDDSKLKLFKELVSNFKSINTERNKYIHSMHLNSDIENTFIRFNSKFVNSEYVVSGVTIEQLIKLNQDIYNCSDEIEKFKNGIKFEDLD